MNHTWESYSGGLPVKGNQENQQGKFWRCSSNWKSGAISQLRFGYYSMILKCVLHIRKLLHQERVNLSISQQQVKRWPRKCKLATTSEFRNFGLRALIRLQEEGIWSWSSKPPPTTQNRPQKKSSNRNVCIFGTQKIFKANIQHIWHTNVFNPNIFV